MYNPLGKKTGPKPQPLMERVWAKINKTEPDACWLWTGTRLPSGYGIIGGSDDPVRGYAHRLILEEALGYQLPKGIYACHKCDNPPCCNPTHLFAGTQSQNMQDMLLKGRGQSGEKNHWAKLTQSQVNKIKMDDRTSIEIAKEYPVSARTIRKIKQGTRWKYLPQGDQ